MRASLPGTTIGHVTRSASRQGRDGVGATEFWVKEGRFRRSARRGGVGNLAAGKLGWQWEVRAEINFTNEGRVLANWDATNSEVEGV